MLARALSWLQVRNAVPDRCRLIRRLLLFILPCVSPAPASTEDVLLRLATPQVEVLTDAGATAGRQALRDFQQIDRILGKLTMGNRRPLRPVRIFLFSSEKSYRPYASSSSASNPGYYLKGRERDYIVMRKTGTEGIDRIVFHEFIHLKIHETDLDVPTWYEEGLAEFYSTVTPGKSEASIGLPIPQRLALLRRTSLLDLRALFAVTHDSPYYNDGRRSGLFYSQSWALVHMLQMSPGYRAGARSLLEILSQGVDSEAAIRDACGKTLDEVSKDLSSYIVQDRLPVERLHDLPALEDKAIDEVPLSPVESSLALAELFVASGKAAQANAMLRGLQHSHPDRPEIESQLGYVALAASRDTDALDHFQRAISLGSASAATWYECAVLLRDKERARAKQYLEKAVALNPGYHEAMYLLGILELQAEEFLPASGHLALAAGLQPQKVFIWQALAQAYFHSKQYDLARQAACRCRQVAKTPQEMQMAEDTVASVAREPGTSIETGHGSLAAAVPSAWQQPKGEKRIEGTLEQVDCLGATVRFHLFAGKSRVAFLVRDPNRVVMKNAGTGSASVNFRCGPGQKNRVAIEYSENPNEKLGTLGDVTLVEFLSSPEP